MTQIQPAQDLKELRESRVLTQSEVASQPHVSAYENGRRMPGARMIKAMAKALKVDPTVVYAACKESCRRASAPRPPALQRTSRRGRKG